MIRFLPIIPVPVVVKIMNSNVVACESVEFVCNDDTVRLDLLVSSQCEITRSNASNLIENGLVRVSGKVIFKKSFKCPIDCVVSVSFPETTCCSAAEQDIPIDIVYEDDDMLVVNKPQGMVVHPAPGNPDGTLVNALMYHCKGRLSTINGVIRPGIVHRIDKDTSGLLVVAKNDFSHVILAEQIKEHSFKRVYNAVIIGSFSEQNGIIDAPVGRHSVNRKKMAVTDKNSKNAVTHYETLKTFRGYSLCRFELETGRTHQIRVHASFKGHPVVGDPLYAPQSGKNPFGLVGQCLHAKVLGVNHPRTNEYLEFTADLPPHFTKTLDFLEKNYSYI